MWAVTTRTGDSGVEIHPLLCCCGWGGVIEGITCWVFLQQLLGEHLVLLLWACQEWVRMYLLLTERQGRDPGLCVFAVFLFTHSSSSQSRQRCCRWEQQSDSGDESVKAVMLENWWLDSLTLKSSWRRVDNLKAQNLMNEWFRGVVWELFSLSVQSNNKDVQWSWKVAN